MNNVKKIGVVLLIGMAVYFLFFYEGASKASQDEMQNVENVDSSN